MKENYEKDIDYVKRAIPHATERDLDYCVEKIAYLVSEGISESEARRAVVLTIKNCNYNARVKDYDGIPENFNPRIKK